MEITTHEITTPMTKTKVVVKDWITGYDDEAIQAHYLNGARKMTGTSDGNASAEYNGNAILEADHEGLKRAIVSVNGSTENIVDAVMNLPLPDSKFVQAEVKRILRPLTDEQSKDSKRSTPAS